jgi:hypothetical protein
MRRLIAGVGLAAVLFAVVPARSTGQTADAAGYDFFTAAGLADGVTSRLVIDEFLAVEEFLSLSSVSAESRLESAQSTGLAVLPDPGDLILSLPGTAAGLAGIPGLPDYPAAARADHPTAPRDEVSLVPDAGLGSMRLLAEADEEHALGRAFVTELVDTVGLIPGFSVGSIRSESTSRRLDPLTYEVRATTTTNDIRLLGGLFRIGQLTTLVTARVDDGRVTASTDETRISGAEIAGQAVGIDEGGFTSPNGSEALQPVVDQLAGPLAEAGYTVTVTPGRVTQEAGQAQADSGTLLIEYRTTVQGYAATFSLGMGRSTATVAAGRMVEADELGALDTGADLPAGDLSGGDTPAGVLGESLETPGDAALGNVPSGGDDGAADVRPVAAVEDLMDFRGLYRLLAVAAAVMVAARYWAVTQARRRPSAARPNLRAKWRW